MGRPKKTAELTELEKDYISLTSKSSNNVNYDELFKSHAIKLNKDEKVIRDHANKVNVGVVDEQLPPEPAPKKLTPSQELARNLLTPNRLAEPNKARHISVMSEAASDTIEKTPSVPIKGSSRMKDVIFRQ
jgi:hypothetical protein